MMEWWVCHMTIATMMNHEGGSKQRGAKGGGNDLLVLKRVSLK